MKEKMLRILTPVLLFALALGTLYGCTKEPGPSENPGSESESSSDPSPVPGTEDEEVDLSVKKNIGIHDPSIFYDPVSGNYYSYGSHMVCGTSPNMVTWEYICGSSVGTSAANKIFPQDFRKEFKEVFDWLDITKDSADFGIWALDVTYSEAAAKAGNNPYFMYVSLVNGTTQSAIALATSDKPEGPFRYAGTIVCADFRESDVVAGHTNLLEVLGKTDVSEMTAEEKSFYFTKNTADYKNKFVDCIDAAPFYDGEGNFYMVYGSFSSAGGVRLIRLDPLTGLRSEENYEKTNDGRQDPYYGKQIAKKRGEGPYILPVKSELSSTGYYYFLFWSQGVLRSTGGYNMRMLRSEYPDHGYVDYAGNGAFSDAGNTALGVRIMDNFLFSCMEYSSTANGGNSAIIRKDGKIFVHYHSKSASTEAYGPEGFIIKSNQMFLNEEGWLVTTPYCYGGETMRPITKEDVIGDYEFIHHRLQYYADPARFEDNYVTSTTIRLNADGTVSGAAQGTWSLSGDNYFTITIGTNTYKGVALEQYDEGATRTKTIVFTAAGKDNRTVWGSKIYYSDKDRVARDLIGLSVPENPTTDFSLPFAGRFLSEITWTSDNAAIAIKDGLAAVTCQDTPQTVKLTATATLNGASRTKTFTITVPAEEYDIPETISSSHIKLPETTATGATITWASSNPSVIDTKTGKVNVPAKNSVVVTLTGTVAGSDRVIKVEVTVMPTPSKVVYSENYDGLTALDASKENGLWYSANAAGNVTLGNRDGGKFVQFAPGNANSRGAISTFPANAQISGIYSIDFDLNLTAGNNQNTEFAVATQNMAYYGVINDGIQSGYLFKLGTTNSTTWTINDGDSFEIPAGKWVHVNALADTDSGKVVVTITAQDGSTLYSGTVRMNNPGALRGFYIRGGRYNSVTGVDNLVVKVNE